MVASRQRILLVDNEQAWLDFSREALQGAGYSVEAVSNPAKVGELIFPPGGKFDLVLVDLRYAQDDGSLLGQFASSGSVGRCVVVLFPTQMTPIQMVEVFRKGGVQDCVDKQYDKERLLSLVREQLERCKAAVLGNHALQRSYALP